MSRRNPKTFGTKEERAAQRAARKAANKAAYHSTQTRVGRNYTPGEADPNRPRPRIANPTLTQKRRKRGDRTDEDCVAEVCELVASGWTAKKALAHIGLSMTQWAGWLVANRYGAQEAYDKARKAQADAWADDIIEESEKATQTNFQGPKLRIETKKWLMGKNCGRYSDKSTVTHEGGERPIRTISSDMTPEEAMAAYAETIRGDKKIGS